MASVFSLGVFKWLLDKVRGKPTVSIEQAEASHDAVIAGGDVSISGSFNTTSFVGKAPSTPCC